MKVIPSIHVIFSGFLMLVSCHAQKSAGIISDAPPTQSVMAIEDNKSRALFDLDYVMGKFDPAVHPDFATVPVKYADKEGRYLRKDVLAAFIRMYEAAAKEGVFLQIKSATRNFESQKQIWENKWTGKTLLEDNVNAAIDFKDDISRAKKILEYSSMPGSSRHHWGTDIDLNAFENEYFDDGQGLKLYNWMQAHAAEYGFCQPYTPQGSDRSTGYFEEKWHWSYLPVSAILTNYAKINLTNDKIVGFKGSGTAGEIDIVKNYMMGISPACTLTSK